MKSKPLPLISVVLPAFNAAQFISNSIDSLLSQDYKNFEVIVINDGSTDNTLSILENLLDERIKVISQPINKGLIAALNIGLENARGKYVTRMDADDLALPSRLLRQVDFMESNPTIGISGGQFVVTGSATGTSDYPLDHQGCLIRQLDQTCFSNNNFIIRRSIVEQYNLQFNSAYLHAEDYKFYTDALKVCKGANLPDVLTTYHKHTSSITGKFLDNSKVMRHKIRVEWCQHLFEVPLSLAEDFYSEDYKGRFKATKAVLKINKEKSIFPDGRLLNTIATVWYKDALDLVLKRGCLLKHYPLFFKFRRSFIDFARYYFVIKWFLKNAGKKI